MRRFEAATGPQHTGVADASGQAADPRGVGSYPIRLLDAGASTPGLALARRLRGRPAPLVFVLGLLAGYALLAAVAIAVGLVLVDVLLPIHVVASSDESVDAWLAAHRNGALNDATMVGSAIGDMPAIPAVVGVAVLVAALRRCWRVAGVIAGGIIIEVATYRAATLVVHRQRPAVVRLDHLPGNQSYPSGHVAAAVAVYVGLALVVSAYTRSRRLARAVWAAASMLAMVVAFSRVYRGMHHPIDVTVGAMIGLASIAVAVWAAQVSSAAARLPSSASRIRT